MRQLIIERILNALRACFNDNLSYSHGLLVHMIYSMSSSCLPAQVWTC